MTGNIGQKKVERAWSAFINNEPIIENDVKDYILRGWKISRDYGIDPDTPPNATHLPEKKFQELLKKNSDMLEAADSVLEMMEISLRDTGFIMTVTASPGYLLKVSGADKELSEADQKLNRAGVSRSVEQVGASALTLSMLENKPIQVSGLEHYNKQFRRWVCSSSPIHDSNGTVIGSLTVSGHLPNKHSHTLALVAAAASSITTQLREKSLREEQARLNSLLLSIYNSLNDGVLSIKNDFSISHANDKARQLLGIQKMALKELSLTDLISREDAKFIRSLLKSGLKENHEINFSHSGSSHKFLCRFLPTTSQGNPEGMTIILTNQQQLIDIARRVGGNYAKYEFSDIKGANSTLRSQVELTKKAAMTSSRILLFGEGGTGKEIFAQAIHNHSLAQNGPFVAVSCAAIPRDLIESELFGYVGGAFTGARQKGMIGKFELAASGTLFLDEINSLPLELQSKLLRALQQKEVVRIGDNKPISITARVVAATNVNLMEAVKVGEFREDLYYRLNVIEITIPPLRERPDDIITLTKYIVRRHCKKIGIRIPSISDSLLKKMQGYSWPGNVRELENLCERSLLLAGSDQLTEEHFPEYISKHPLKERKDIGTITDNNKSLIERALEKHSGNISKAAKELGIARSTIYRNIQKHQINTLSLS
jgi:transcriptional regulator with PAS, ATPase and Fis domain